MAVRDRGLVETESDGRRARRDRNRDAVVDALLTLYAEGNLAPSTDEIAARAELSSRSLFRYFADVDDLTRAAITRQHERLRPLVEIGVRLDAPRDERIRALAAQRAALFDAIGGSGIVSRMRAPFHPTIAVELSQARSLLRSQLRWIMETELRAMAPDAAARALAAADVVSSFESYRLLRDDQALPRAAAIDTIVAALGALFPEEGS